MTKEERRQLAIENLTRGRAEQKRRREAMAQASQAPSQAARPDAAAPAADPVPAPAEQISPTVCLNVPTQVSINGVDYIGYVEVPRETADTIRSLCSGVETEKKKMFDSTVHPYESIGHIE